MRLALSSPAPLSLTLPAGSKWEVSAEVPGFWVPRKALAVGPSDQPSRLALDLWPLGSISGVVLVKGKKTPPPRQVLVRSLAAPAFLNRPVAPKGDLDCPVDKKGFWSCSLPAATYDLVISAEGLSSHYRWSVQVPAGKTLSLGAIELERGASVAGWVAVEEGAIEPGRCTARLAVLVAGGSSLKSVSDLERTAFERQVGKDGFFQLSGLAPGTYALEVRQPGFPPVRRAPVRVAPGAETLLAEPLILRHSLDLQFAVHPALDWLGRPWRAQIFQLGERQPVPLVFDGTADEGGRLAVPGQSSGRFRVDLKDSLGNRLYSGEHSVDGPNSAPQSIEVRFITVEGRIRLGEEPLVSTLWFGGSYGATSVKMEADAEGRFHGVLPREGLWRIEIAAGEPGFPTWTRAEVQASRSGKARVEIVLPDTRIFGRVVDEQGKPVPKADVAIQGESVELATTADADGSYEVRALPQGPVWLGAQSSSQLSDRVFATLVEGRAVGPIELRLHSTRQLSGTVLSSRGPVVGSRVTVLARAPGGSGAVATTGTDGAFHVDLPQAVSRVEVVVSAPGFALRAFDASTEGEPLVLQVTEEGGGLEITLPLTEDEILRENLLLAIFQNGFFVPGSAWGQWAYDQGQPRGRSDRTLRVPNVAPGEYRACLLPRQLEMSLASVLVPEEAICSSGFLAPGATLSLKPGRP
ncbi:MAG TPA: carboxypeptidase-like regulatory domain-containing protein [Thermoanaerobaculia bacterium]|nr:carboxypeptidase-like regulatory domain-containing protein [Thermoanaerobaculia bacterium]